MTKLLTWYVDNFFDNKFATTNYSFDTCDVNQGKLKNVIMNSQFRFEKQKINENSIFNIMPEQLLMLDLQIAMNHINIKTFKAYLKEMETTRIQRTTISIKAISKLLNVSEYLATELTVRWMNNIGGSVVDHAGIHAYYFKGVYEIIN